jgi:hypothetical protein
MEGIGRAALVGNAVTAGFREITGDLLAIDAEGLTNALRLRRGLAKTFRGAVALGETVGRETLVGTALVAGF